MMMQMTRSWSALRLASLSTAIASLVLLAGYMASPYVALWQIGQALRSNDVRELRAAVDWSGVRAGLKEEIEASLADAPPVAQAVASRSGTPAASMPVLAPQAAMARVGGSVPAASRPVDTASAADDLPEFGDSFATTAVSQSVDQDCTPEKLAGMLGAKPDHSSTLAEARRAITWAFFTGPRRFEALVNPGAGASHPVRVQMAFSRRHGWKVTRVWLPPEMLDQGGQERT